MKTNKKLILFTTLTILWTIVIFSFSLQNGEESSRLSGGIVAWIVEVIFPADFPYVEQMETIVRKGAHFTEYFILGIFASLTVRETKSTRPVLTAWIIGTLVACCDETIQLFSDGRAGQVTDVMLDSSGVLCGCAMLYILYKKFVVKRIS